MSFLREPLFHFLLMGAALFGWFAVVSPPAPEPEQPNTILVDDQDVERLSLRFEATRQRPPSDQELVLLVDTLVRQEVLVREAERLGLDIGDEIIRNRLAQKMAFLMESGARSQVPEDDVLRAFMQDNPDRFEQPGWLALEQVFLGQTPDKAEVAKAQTDLASGADPLNIGRHSQLPPYLPPSRAQQIDGTFGRGFFAAVDDLPSNTWSGPIQSAFGQHLVRITDRAPTKLPPFEGIRDAVIREWTRDKAQELSDTRFEQMKSGYEIVLPQGFTSAPEVAE